MRDSLTRAFYNNKLARLSALKEALDEAALQADELMSGEAAAPVPDSELVSYLSNQLSRLEDFSEVVGSEIDAVVPLAF